MEIAFTRATTARQATAAHQIGAGGQVYSNDERETAIPCRGTELGSAESTVRRAEFHLPSSDTTAPAVTITSPANGATYTQGQTIAASFSCQDEPGGSGVASCSGTVADGALIDTATVGTHSFSFTVTGTDNAGNSASVTHTYNVAYRFTGFVPPVDNLPTLNVATGGSAVPVKFSLGGNQGFGIFAAGYPASSPVACSSTEPGDVIEETVTVGNSSLSYNSPSDEYNYVWKTDKSWRGTCRILIVRLNDQSEHFARFRFR